MTWQQIIARDRQQQRGGESWLWKGGKLCMELRHCNHSGHLEAGGWTTRGINQDWFSCSVLWCRISLYVPYVRTTYERDLPLPHHVGFKSAWGQFQHLTCKYSNILFKSMPFPHPLPQLQQQFHPWFLQSPRMCLQAPHQPAKRTIMHMNQ